MERGQPGGKKSALSMLFGGASSTSDAGEGSRALEEHDDDALRYVPPKEPKGGTSAGSSSSSSSSSTATTAPPRAQQQPTAVQQQETAGPSSSAPTASGASSLVFSTTIRLYAFNRSMNSYEPHAGGAVLGAVILAGGSRETLLVYDAAKVPQWSLPITATTDFRVQPNNYVSFPQQACSALLDSPATVAAFCRHLAAAKTVALQRDPLASSSPAVVRHEVAPLASEGAASAAESVLQAGDVAGVQYSIFEVGDDGSALPAALRSPLDSNAGQGNAVCRVKVGGGGPGSGDQLAARVLSEALVGCRKLGRYLFIIPASTAARAEQETGGQRARARPGSWLLAEVEVQKAKKAAPPSQQQPPPQQQQQEAALPTSTAAPAQPPSDSETAPTPPADAQHSHSLVERMAALAAAGRAGLPGGVMAMVPPQLRPPGRQHHQHDDHDDTEQTQSGKPPVDPPQVPSSEGRMQDCEPDAPAPAPLPPQRLLPVPSPVRPQHQPQQQPPPSPVRLPQPAPTRHPHQQPQLEGDGASSLLLDLHSKVDRLLSLAATSRREGEEARAAATYTKMGGRYSSEEWLGSFRMLLEEHERLEAAAKEGPEKLSRLQEKVEDLQDRLAALQERNGQLLADKTALLESTMQRSTEAAQREKELAQEIERLKTGGGQSSEEREKLEEQLKEARAEADKERALREEAGRRKDELEEKVARGEVRAQELEQALATATAELQEERERAAQAAAKDKEEPEGLPSPPSTSQAPAGGDGQEKETEAEQMREKLSAVEEQLRQAEDRASSLSSQLSSLQASQQAREHELLSSTLRRFMVDVYANLQEALGDADDDQCQHTQTFSTQEVLKRVRSVLKNTGQAVLHAATSHHPAHASEPTPQQDATPPAPSSSS